MADHPSYKGAALAGKKLHDCLVQALLDAEDAVALSHIRQCLDTYEEEVGLAR